MRQATNYTTTENGALTNKSTLNNVLDFYYHAAARRGNDNTDLFAMAYAEDAVLALRALFYLRDIRGGSKIGERESFRQGLRYLYANKRDVFNALVLLVPEYGRWDDVLEFVDSSVVVQMVKAQLGVDIESASIFTDRSVSLLGKWMPSINTSSKKTVALARKWIKALGTTEVTYRYNLSMLRKHINIVERLMSANEFSGIDYATVPSKAAMLYRKAFSKQDADRYVAYLEDVKSGKKKINATTLYPYEIAGKYLNGAAYNETLELQWSALPNYADSDHNALVMADVSGSMSGDPLNVAVSLAIYFAERNKGLFHDYFMTFSSRPSLERVIGNNLREKVDNVSRAHWEQSTNIQGAFNLMLDAAITNNVPVEEMPTMLFIISDMEFDVASRASTNFNVIQQKYNTAGYTMPKLVFWNVRSRNDQTPVTEKEENVYLVSGASAGVFKAALNAKAINPYEMMIEVLNDDRYDAVAESVSRVRL